MRYLARIFSLLPMTVAQSARKSAVVSFCTMSSKDHGARCRECLDSMAGARAGSADVWLLVQTN